MWSLNPLLLDPPLHVGRLRASVPRPDRTGLKEQLLPRLWLTQAGGRERYGGGGASLRRQRRRDVAPARGVPCVLPGKLSPDHGTLAVVAAQVPGRGGVESDLCSHTCFLVVAAAALASPACLWGSR